MATLTGKEPTPPLLAERLSGPHGPGADRGGWDSATLELHGDGRFVLEMWRFYESWDYLPEDDGEGPLGAGNLRSEVVDHLPRAMRPREVEEVRVTFTGRCRQRPVPSLRLRGLAREELNQDFVEDPSRPIGGLPSWWSADGRAFLYFSEEQGHWRANTVRLAGGDGARFVGRGGRRAGAGPAHSGPAGGGAASAAAALARADGWCEEVDGEWRPARVQASLSRAAVLDFRAERAVVEERHLRGEEGDVERQVGDGLAFRGWRVGGRGGDLRLALPPMPERHAPAEDLAPAAAVGPASEGGTTILGDPDFVILRTASRL